MSWALRKEDYITMLTKGYLAHDLIFQKKDDKITHPI